MYTQKAAALVAGCVVLAFAGFGPALATATARPAPTIATGPVSGQPWYGYTPLSVAATKSGPHPSAPPTSPAGTPAEPVEPAEPLAAPECVDAGGFSCDQWEREGRPTKANGDPANQGKGPSPAVRPNQRTDGCATDPIGLQCDPDGSKLQEEVDANK